MIKGKCHCGQVTYEFTEKPEYAIRCNCSICRRLGTLWIYADASTITLKGVDNTNTVSYSHGDMELDFRTCKGCGTSILWQSVETPGKGRMALNLNMAELEDIYNVPMRLFDGAESWSFFDHDPQTKHPEIKS
jgi:hypothetical protein